MQIAPWLAISYEDPDATLLIRYTCPNIRFSASILGDDLTTENYQFWLSAWILNQLNHEPIDLKPNQLFTKITDLNWYFVLSW